MSNLSAFWDDLSRDLEDPEFYAAYVDASQEIERIDARYSPD